jgi:hypothetical protein
MTLGLYSWPAPLQARLGRKPKARVATPPLQWVFCGQTAPSPYPYECSGQIICIRSIIIRSYHKFNSIYVQTYSGNVTK